LSYMAHNKDKSAKTMAWEKEAWQQTVPLLAKNQRVEAEVIERFYAWQREQKILTEPVDLKAIRH